MLGIKRRGDFPVPQLQESLEMGDRNVPLPIFAKSKLYCIGGGNPRDPQMVDHYQRIVTLARNSSGPARSPHIAILPTAHRNGTHSRLQALDFIVTEFSKSGCTTEQILIGDLPPDKIATPLAAVERILQHADALFVPGGDTRYLLKIVRELGLQPIFEQALANGLLFSGSSAGTVWLAQATMSDSEAYQQPDGWNFVRLEALGILPFIVNVHDDHGVSVGNTSHLARIFHNLC